MKTQFVRVLAALILWVSLHRAAAQGTAFIYQGQLQNNGSPASGTYNLTFALFTASSGGGPVAGPVTANGVIVTNGMLTVTIDFGSGVFAGATNWLQIGVETNGGSTFTTLTPRQQLTPVPYAIFATTSSNVSGTIPAAQVTGPLPSGSLSGAYGGAVTLSNAGNSFSGTFIGNGGGLTNLAEWQLAGNTGSSNGNFLGTSDNQPLEIRVGGARAGLISPNNGVPNVVLGTAQNLIGSTTAGASILGGGGDNIGTNSSYSVIGGGQQNSILNNAAHSVIGGGQLNSIQPGAIQSSLGGGYANTIQSNASTSVIAGGYGNVIQTGANFSVIGGGNNNVIWANAVQNVLVGGYQNSINSSDSVVVGGQNNAIELGAAASVIVGGNGNAIQSNNTTSFIGGGSGNTIAVSTVGNSFIGGGANNFISTNCGSSVIGGGSLNQIQAKSSVPSLAATIVGGQGNIISPAAYYSFIGGGYQNLIGNGGTNADYAVVPGGINNYAGGAYSFAAGQRAKANFQGDFVWADSQPADLNSTTNDQFLVRAKGGVQFVTGGAGLNVDGIVSCGPIIANGPINLGGPVFTGPIVSSGLVSAASFVGGPVVCCSITITGGCDLAEPFQITARGRDIPEGAVVVIDEQNPGHLKMSDQAYDSHVAGVVSGANGINPGIQMQQQGLLEGGRNVALTGRVYVQADASNGPIKPGDLLTTSSAPGRAMRVSDHLKAQGAILGKAMAGLKDGQGMVLVLVTLQ